MMPRLGLTLLGLLPAGIGLHGAWWLGRRAGGRPHLTLTAGLAALAVVLLVALLGGLELLVPGGSLPAWFATSGPTTPPAPTQASGTPGVSVRLGMRRTASSTTNTTMARVSHRVAGAKNWAGKCIVTS